jgi:hypothetical protein
VAQNCPIAASDVDIACLTDWRAEMIVRRGKALEKFSALVEAGK